MDYTCYCLFSCLSLIPDFTSDPEFYVSSYYSGCSHEQTRDRSGGYARVDAGDEQEAYTYYLFIYLPVLLMVAALGISSVPFFLFL